MRRILFIVIVIIISIHATAYDFKKGRIYYKILSKKDSIVSVDTGKEAYNGVLIVPSWTTYRGRKWKVVSIEKDAFRKSENLRFLQLPFIEPPHISANTFPTSVYWNMLLFIPKGTYEKYNKADVWKEFIYKNQAFTETSDDDIDKLDNQITDLSLPQEIFPAPVIKMGKSVVRGILKNGNHDTPRNCVVCIMLVNPFFNDCSVYNGDVGSTGKFSIEVPMYLDKQFAVCGLLVDSKPLGAKFIGLDQGNPLQMNFNIDENKHYTATLQGGLNLTDSELKSIANVDLRSWYPVHGVPLVYNMTPEEFIKHERDNIDDEAEFIMYPYSFTNRMYEMIKEYLWVKEIPNSFDYKASLEKNKVDFYNPDNKLMPDTIEIVEPTKSYFSFLGEHLNDPRLLYSAFSYYMNESPYYNLMTQILNIKQFGIKDIGDIPVNEWIKSVKDSIAGIFGYDSEFFYDMLVTTIYSKQMNEELKELSDIQKTNINTYFQNREPGIPEILLDINSKIVKKKPYAKRLVSYTIDSIHGVSPENIIESIAAKHHGRITLIDIWATWCSPCMNAHKEMRAVKDSLRNAGVDFVYISDTSSPRKDWEEDIKYIGDEHYYLDHKDVSLILDKYKLKGFPSYFIFDKKGKMCNCFCGFKGIEDMLEKLNHVAILQK